MITWSADELDSLDLGDKRLNARLKSVLEQCALFPSLSIPSTFTRRGDEEAVYRLFSNDRTTAPRVLQPHYTSTLARAREYDRILVAHDTTEYDFTRYQERVGGRLNGEKRRGFLNHVLLALTDAGVPLGLVWSHFWARPSRKVPRGTRRPIEKKESYRWLVGQEKTKVFKSQLPASTQVISITDSECDIYEYLVASRGSGADPRGSFIVRAHFNRTLENSDSPLFEALGAASIFGTQCVHVQEQRAASMDGRRRKCAKMKRDAVVEIRASQVTLVPPEELRGSQPNLRLNAVLSKEIDPPEGQHPLEWLLLTDLPIDTWEQVQEIIRLYGCRWQIEVYFKTLKSGCRVEELQLESDDSLLPCLALKQIVAWRVQYLTMLARSSPTLPCDEVLEAAEWQSVFALTQREAPPKAAPTLLEIIEMIATLGGYRKRRGHEQPGPKALWIGMQRMQDLATGWRMARTRKGHRKKCVGR